MLLYHGTSSRHLGSILEHGLRPRGRRKGNWKHTVTSNNKGVYLTEGYALHFGLNGTREGTEEKIAIIEIDLDLLPEYLLAPDEDFLEQVSRQDPNLECYGWSMKKRTLWFRKRAFTHFQHHWKLSLARMGTCMYYGDIPPSALTRVSLVPYNHGYRWMSDPSVGVSNYRNMAAFYRNLTRCCFGDFDALEDDFIWTMRSDDLPDHAGVEVRKLK